MIGPSLGGLNKLVDLMWALGTLLRTTGFDFLGTVIRCICPMVGFSLAVGVPAVAMDPVGVGSREPA